MYKIFFKRFLDVFFSIFSLILLFPIFLFVFVVLIVNNQGNPFFFQNRPGKNEKIFKVIKFKTMNDKKDAKGNLLPDEQRITKLGEFIRKTSLDEIPQLVNVLIGHMSFIGPRPLLVEYLSYYSDSQKKRHHVRPGISGWAQVNGRNTISWEQKFEYDVWYVENFSLLLDVKIFFMTFLKVFKSEGINTENNTTAIKFNGKN